MKFGIFVALFIATCAAARAAALPPRIAPPAPFPRILQQAPTLESIAPGVDYGEYQLVTDAGPLAVRVVAIDSHRRDLHVGSVVATDSLVSPGETVGSMARRTRAVAGINGDYFDIGAYQPADQHGRARRRTPSASLQALRSRHNPRRHAAYCGVHVFRRARHRRANVAARRDRPNAAGRALAADAALRARPAAR